MLKLFRLPAFCLFAGQLDSTQRSTADAPKPSITIEHTCPGSLIWPCCPDSAARPQTLLAQPTSPSTTAASSVFSSPSPPSVLALQRDPSCSTLFPRQIDPHLDLCGRFVFLLPQLTRLSHLLSRVSPARKAPSALQNLITIFAILKSSRRNCDPRTVLLRASHLALPGLPREISYDLHSTRLVGATVLLHLHFAILRLTPELCSIRNRSSLNPELTSA